MRASSNSVLPGALMDKLTVVAARNLSSSCFVSPAVGYHLANKKNPPLIQLLEEEAGRTVE